MSWCVDRRGEIEKRRDRRKTRCGFVRGEGEDGLEATEAQAREAITFICTSHSRDGVRLGVSRRLAGSKMFLVDMDVDVDTTDKVPIMVD